MGISWSGCYWLCFYVGIKAFEFRKIIILGADILSCFCWMGDFPSFFLLPSLVLRRVVDVVFPAGNYSGVLIGVSTGGSR